MDLRTPVHICMPTLLSLIPERKFRCPKGILKHASCYTGAGCQMSDLSGIWTVSITTFAAKIIMFVTFLFISRLHFNIVA